MPSATATKSAEAGKKRKSAPVKDVRSKESKKPKIESSNAKTMKKERKVAAREASTDSDSLDSDAESDGGAPVSGSASEEMEEDNPIIKVADGVHPDRAKAANSKFASARIIIILH